MRAAKLWLLCLLTFLILPTSRLTAQAEGKKWALLIGVEAYDNPDVSHLDFAVKDVTAVANALRNNAGFAPENVRVMTSALQNPDDPNRPTNLHVLKVLDRLADEVGPDDTLLLYFTGHGFAREGQSFLGSVNTDPSSVESLELSAIPLAKLQSKMKKMKAWQVIFMVDACRNDPDKGKGDADNRRTEAFTKSLLVAARPEGASIGGSAVLFACSEGERAFEDPQKQQSVFTYYLLEALSGKAEARNGSLTMTDTADYVQKQVTAWAKERSKQQTPELVQVGAARIVLTDHLSGAGSGVATNGEKPAGGKVLVLDTDARLDIKSDPAGAKILLDGKDSGQTTPASLDLELTAATKDLQVQLQFEGYKPLTLAVTLERGKVTTIEQTLKKRTAITLPGDEQAAQTKINPKDGAEMIYIPAGEFVMGENASNRLGSLLRPTLTLASYPQLPAGTQTPSRRGTQAASSVFDNPRHTVLLSGYWIYKNLVTVKQYKQFCSETGRQMPPEPTGAITQADGTRARVSINLGWSKEDHPMVNVTWEDAAAYATWAGVSLPTEAQWEKAARGTDGRIYPWGNDFDRTKLWASKSVAGDAGGTAAVGQYGVSVYGCTDMTGNVEQWCADWYDTDYYKTSPLKDPVGPVTGELRVMRGGYWGYYTPDQFRVTLRRRNSIIRKGSAIGFRCAQ